MFKSSKILLADHPAYTEAVDAMRRYHDAQNSGVPAVEVAGLRQIAEFLFHAITDYQMRACGVDSVTTY
ncbi:hypothetical protein QQ992_21815 [Pseudomonas kurunegalensis]|nr:hypothetical protein [Pseudomonas kurunegalensis]WJD65407.1 hypothetical protein QQ992_21815 [Pseudomonas kurunegalensis]